MMIHTDSPFGGPPPEGAGLPDYLDPDPVLIDDEYDCDLLVS